ncbi:ATP-binding cassette domain-containing protein [Undibacterium sp. Jales W-56]|uniref:ABC transporter ATP-binding protein n=1 Tax=Undibacterium sp. Jales W-56 TaxID=2897325 RepID=UPI0021CE99E1|nr:ATP-binding cassette domain-containing protein [Undibacterium sp. Jales W-56]MCU6435662.1 ATP-binding cassette domain-containing protein [Undibacterium sp. Jales W-56]
MDKVITSYAAPGAAAADNAHPVIDIQGLRTQFGRAVVHDNLQLQVRQGEILSIVGGSGSGKTVLMRQMLGLEKPSRGSIRVFDEDIHAPTADNLDFLRRRSGMLFQNGALYSALTVFDNVAQPMREMGTLSESLIADMVYLKLHMSGIAFEHARKMPSDLSGGMVKRIALARALALDPELLFLDEPTAGLDPDRSDSFVSLIQALHQQLNLTVVMVTHDLDTLFALSNRIAVLAEKKVVTIGAPQEVVQFQHPFIEKFFLGGRGIRAMEVFAPAGAEGVTP